MTLINTNISHFGRHVNRLHVVCASIMFQRLFEGALAQPSLRARCWRSRFAEITKTSGSSATDCGPWKYRHQWALLGRSGQQVLGQLGPLCGVEQSL